MSEAENARASMEYYLLQMRSAQITVPKRTALACGILLLIFAAVSYSAVLTKNATLDEPLDAISGWFELRRGDFRMVIVNPPLWQCWAALGNAFATPTIIFDSPLWNDLSWEPEEEYAWSCRTLYSIPQNGGDAFVNRSRAMMLVLGVALGVLVAFWSYRLAGPVAAITATLFFALDPNLLAHAPLVKSDVALGLVLTGLSCLTQRLGDHATIARILFVGLLCGAAVGVKFSGVIAGPILMVLLLVRVISSRPWKVGPRLLNTRMQRLGAMVVIAMSSAIICFIFIWGCYFFRYRPAPSPSVQINLPAIYRRTALIETTLAQGHHATADDLARHEPSLPTRLIQFADRHRLLPQAFSGGILYQRDCTLSWPAYLDGELYGNGRWYYFPLAMLYKTPFATLVAFAGTGVMAGGLVFKALRGKTVLTRMRHAKTTLDGSEGWAVACIVVPFSIFGLVALRTPINIGVRNVLPLYPFLYISVGCLASWAWNYRPRVTTCCIALLATGLAVETLYAWPDYIAFFNVAAGGEIGGIKHLSDSNLDWGQDIKALAAWQVTRPPEPLFSDYDGAVDPHFYGLKYHPIWVNSTGRLVSDVPVTAGLLAIRATHLQGLYVKPEAARFYARLRQQRPIAVIGGTIYIYDFQM